MDRHLVVNLLAGLLCMLAAIGVVWLRKRSRKQSRERQERTMRQAERERVAALRIANNGGKALSTRFAAATAVSKMPERTI